MFGSIELPRKCLYVGGMLHELAKNKEHVYSVYAM